MTRSTAFRPAPALALLVLALAAVSCGGGGDAAADPTTVPATTDGPAGPDATVAVAAGADRSDATLPSGSAGAPTTATLAPVTAITVVTVPPTTARPTSTSRPPSTTATTAPSSTATTAAPAGQRVAGTVMASPSCPVERPDQPCPPRPVAAAHVEVFDRAEHLVSSTDADAEGRFALALAPGRYVLTASSGTVFPSCPPFTVEVPAAGEARADIVCDSGIR